MRSYNGAMRPWLAALAALCASLAGRSHAVLGQTLVATQAAGAATAAPTTIPATADRAASSPQPAAAAAAAARRADPVYRVELVIFRAASAPGSPENWAAEASGAPPPEATPQGTPPQVTPPQVTPPDTSTARTNGDPVGAAQPAGQRALVRLLPSSELELAELAARLRSSGHYLPVAEVAWWQTASPWGRPIEIPVQSLGVDAEGLSGTVSLQRGEFLHLEVSLDYAMQDPPPALGAAPGTVFSLHDMHRVRFNERNYFDHPAFGVIALVTPVQEPRRARK